MARHPTARRTHREQPAHSDDVFVERVLTGSVWAKENARLLIISITVVVVVFGGLLYYRNYSARLRDRAETELTAIRTTLLSGNYALAARDLETFLQRNGGTPTAAEARVLLARAYLQTGEPQRAIETIEPQANDISTPYGVQSAMLLGAAQEAALQPDRAIEVYLRIADRAPFDYQKRQALDAVARIRTERGDARGAVTVYDRILTLLPANDPDRPVYELRRAEAAARAAAGS